MVRFNLLVLILLFSISFAKAQQKMESGTWYAYDLKNPGKALKLTVVDHPDTERSFDVTKELIIEDNNKGKKKKKKKKSFGKFMKALADEAQGKKTKKAEKPLTRAGLLEGKMLYQLEKDNLDDDVLINCFRFERGISRITAHQVLGENSKLQAIYGFTFPIENNFYKEVTFFKNGKFKTENPDDVEGIFIIGRDKEATKQKAASMNFEDEKRKFYTPDYSTGRTPNPVVVFDEYSIDLDLEEETGELSLSNTSPIYFLPSKTIEGKNIYYHWEALKVTLKTKEGKIVNTVVGTKSHRNRRWLEKVRNDIEFPYSSFGKIKPGVYQLDFQIYNDEPFITSELEIYTKDNPDITAENPKYYLMKGNSDGFLFINEDLKSEKEYKKAIEFRFRKTRMLHVIGDRNRVDAFNAKLYKNGKFYAVSSYYNGYHGAAKKLNRNNVLKIHQEPEDVRDEINSVKKHTFSIINPSVTHNSWKLLDGNNITDGSYKIEYYTDGKLFAEATFEVKNKRIVLQGNQKKEAAASKRYMFCNPEYPETYIPLVYKY